MSILKRLAKRRKRLSDQTRRPPIPAPQVLEDKRKKEKHKWKMVTEVDSDWQD